MTKRKDVLNVAAVDLIGESETRRTIETAAIRSAGRTLPRLEASRLRACRHATPRRPPHTTSSTPPNLDRCVGSSIPRSPDPSTVFLDPLGTPPSPAGRGLRIWPCCGLATHLYNFILFIVYRSLPPPLASTSTHVTQCSVSYQPKMVLPLLIYVLCFFFFFF